MFAHELIKIKIHLERDLREQYTKQICEKSKAELIQSIGSIIAIYRKNIENKN